MAHMHSRKKGKSKSKHPLRSVPEWIAYSPDEVVELILKLAREGNPPSKVGLILRDQYGVPSVKNITNKGLSQILKENKISAEIPEDLQNLVRRAVNLRKHMDQHKKDVHNKRGLVLIESKIYRLTKYYKREGKIPSEWAYEPERAKLKV